MRICIKAWRKGEDFGFDRMHLYEYGLWMSLWISMLGSSSAEYSPRIPRAGSIVFPTVWASQGSGRLGVAVLMSWPSFVGVWDPWIRGYPSNHHRVQVYLGLVTELLYKYVRAIVLASEALWSTTVLSSYCGTFQ